MDVILVTKLLALAVVFGAFPAFLILRCFVVEQRERTRRLARRMAEEKPAVEVTLLDPAMCRHPLDRRRIHYEPFVGQLEMCIDCGHCVRVISESSAQSPPRMPPELRTIPLTSRPSLQWSKIPWWRR